MLKARDSGYSEFVAVYGRRRVGKTFLIRETFDYRFTFQYSGVKLGGATVQLARFRKSLQTQGYAECYMIFGGIPYYWHFLEKGLSVAQNVDNIFFA